MFDIKAPATDELTKVVEKLINLHIPSEPWLPEMQWRVQEAIRHATGELRRRVAQELFSRNPQQYPWQQAKIIASCSMATLPDPLSVHDWTRETLLRQLANSLEQEVPILARGIRAHAHNLLTSSLSLPCEQTQGRTP